MGWKDLLYKSDGGKGKEVATAESEAEDTAEPALTVATGPLSGRKASRMPRRTFAPTAAAKVSQEKLGDLRKRVLGTASALTLVLDQADKLGEAGISDPTQQYRGAIKTTGVSQLEVQDALSKHKTLLLEQKQKFAAHVTGLRTSKMDRRAEIEKELAEIQERFQMLEKDDANLVQELQELDASEREFATVADTLDTELTTLGEQVVSLFHA